MHLCMIAAMSENRVIGHKDALPRHFPEDLQRFKALTMWCPVVMGRKTYQSIGKPLPGRRNVVISRTKKFADLPDIEQFDDPDDALAVLSEEIEENDPVFIIGWSSLYLHFLDQAEYIYMTHIHSYYQGDAYFPAFEDHFEEIERQSHPQYDFVVRRKKRQE